MPAQTKTTLPAYAVDEDGTTDTQPLLDLLRIVGGACTDCRRQYSACAPPFSVSSWVSRMHRDVCPVWRKGSIEMSNSLRDQLVAHIHRRACFLTAWREAERNDRAIPADCPVSVLRQEALALDSGLAVPDEWDAAAMGCGELVMALRLKLHELPAGSVLKVTATDPAAPEDLPAWCRMTGHTLMAMNHPIYFIRRKGD